jgi:excisionase family DNA binding protein
MRKALARNNNATEDAVTVAELARHLRVDRKSVYAAIHAGQLPGARQFGRTWRISLGAVMRWLAKGDRTARQRPVRAECEQL